MDNEQPETVSDSNDNWPKSCQLAIKLSQRLDVDELSALYLAIEDYPETLLAAIGPHIERLAGLRKRAAELSDATGSPRETVNHYLLADVRRVRKEADDQKGTK